jgi:hypothetical protein
MVYEYGSSPATKALWGAIAAVFAVFAVAGFALQRKLLGDTPTNRRIEMAGQ